MLYICTIFIFHINSMPHYIVTLHALHNLMYIGPCIIVIVEE